MVNKYYVCAGEFDSFQRIGSLEQFVNKPFRKAILTRHEARLWTLLFKGHM